MKKELFLIKISDLEDEKRLYYSAVFLFTILSFLTAHLFTKKILVNVFAQEQSPQELQQQKENEKIYEVLLEQKKPDKKKTEQVKALSDADSSGSGGLTEKYGFHTLTPFREFIFGGESLFTKPQEEKEKSEEKQMFIVSIETEDPLADLSPSELDTFTSTSKSKESKKVSQEKQQEKKQVAKQGEPTPLTKIPFNYRFQQDFRFRWSGSGAIKIPTKKLAGYKYFKNMLKQIEDKFAPPGGGNFAYRDMAGTVVSQGIIPGEVRVVFLLNDNGQVIDIKKANQHGQQVVEQACLDAIRGQSFGPVPEEIKKTGLIFGINFIFPGYR
ncbi:MAG: TonB-dependent receptor [Spirochaetota bacterium]